MWYTCCYYFCFLTKCFPEKHVIVGNCRDFILLTMLFQVISVGTCSGCYSCNILLILLQVCTWISANHGISFRCPSSFSLCASEVLLWLCDPSLSLSVGWGGNKWLWLDGQYCNLNHPYPQCTQLLTQSNVHMSDLKGNGENFYAIRISFGLLLHL